MGANEKLQAAMHGFIPATDEVRALYVAGTPAHRVSVATGYAEFDRWLATVRADAKAEALTEMAKMIESKAKILDPEDPIQKGARIGLITASVDLTTRANQHKEAPDA